MHPTGGRAYGYERVRDARDKVVHRIYEPEAAILREVANRALAGESLTRLSAELNRRGVPTSLGGRWQPSKLRALLTSPFHTGRFPDGARGSWPALFSDDEATLLRARFPRDENAGIGRGRGPRPGRAYALAGVAVCSECGRKLLGSSGAYRCQARNGGCGKVRIPSWPVDQYVDEQVWRRPEVWEADAEQAALQRQRTTDTEPLLAEVRAAEARLLELHEAYAAGEITLDDFKLMRDAVGPTRGGRRGTDAGDGSDTSPNVAIPERRGLRRGRGALCPLAASRADARGDRRAKRLLPGVDREGGRLARPSAWTSAQGCPVGRARARSDRVAIAPSAGDDTPSGGYCERGWPLRARRGRLRDQRVEQVLGGEVVQLVVGEDVSAELLTLRSSWHSVPPLVGGWGDGADGGGAPGRSSTLLVPFPAVSGTFCTLLPRSQMHAVDRKRGTLNVAGAR
jgi:hypothetical protein